MYIYIYICIAAKAIWTEARLWIQTLLGNTEDIGRTGDVRHVKCQNRTCQNTGV